MLELWCKDAQQIITGEQANEAEMTDYKEWLSRFTGIYVFAFKGEIERVGSALEWLQETNPSDEELEKIWDTQVAHNIHRRNSIRKKIPIKRDTSNLYKFFKEKHWDRMITSSDEQVERGHATCCECFLSRPSRERGWIISEEKTYCSPCWAKKYEAGPTGFGALRKAYQRRIEQRPGETGHQYIGRVFGTRKARSVESDKPEVPSDGGVNNHGPKGLPEDEWNHG